MSAAATVVCRQVLMHETGRRQMGPTAKVQKNQRSIPDVSRQ